MGRKPSYLAQAPNEFEANGTTSDNNDLRFALRSHLADRLMKGTISALASLAILGALPAAAHHSFDLAFDRNKLVSLTGKVTEFTFANPHTYLKLEVVRENGTKQLWHVETTSAGQLNKQGWNAHSIKPGEMLSLEGFASKNDRPYLRLLSMSYADGGRVALWLPAGPTAISGG